MNTGEKETGSREYTNGEITVIWRPDLCDHSAVCLTQLPKVFDNSRQPWIDMNAASSHDIVDTVNECPTAALTFRYNKETTKEQTATTEEIASPQVSLVKGGPIIISGSFTLKNEAGKTKTFDKKTAFCRCGKSGKMPFCDGSHL